MSEVKPINASPQIGVRFSAAELERIRERAERDYAGVVSTLVKVAVKRFLDAEPDGEKDEAAA